MEVCIKMKPNYKKSFDLQFLPRPGDRMRIQFDEFDYVSEVIVKSVYHNLHMLAGSQLIEITVENQ